MNKNSQRPEPSAFRHPDRKGVRIMTASAAKSRLTHYVAMTEKVTYREAENAIRTMTGSERLSLSVKAKKWRAEQSKTKATKEPA